MLVATLIVFRVIDRDPPVVAGPTVSASPSSPSPSPSPSPTYPPGIDPCLLGTWRVTVNAVYGRIDNDRVQYIGGADTTITYRTDNTYTYDYAETKPQTTTYGGRTYSNKARGTATIRYHADGATMLVSMVSNDATSEVRRDGVVVNKASTSYLMEPQQYRCTPERLVLASSEGKYTIEAVRVSAATIPGSD